MTDFKTIKTEEIKHGSAGFIEVSRKQAEDETKSTEFIHLSRGFVKHDGNKKYEKNFTLPLDIKDAVADALKRI